ncbi:MAG TPA: hypothetical protein VIO64_14145, partial [Pseudobacteroides sp.]|uniref:hypothetical protein n=1 Tax=Pseudobacteroides sp. TaxID=1968840 RepID=UPI002F926194
MKIKAGITLIITFLFGTLCTFATYDEIVTEYGEESNTSWQTTNPFIDFQDGTSTQVIKEKARNSDYWYSTDYFEISLIGTNQKITILSANIMSENRDEAMVTTTFKTNWEKDVIPRFNTQNISGSLNFKIDAVIRMNAKNKLPSYC